MSFWTRLRDLLGYKPITDEDRFQFILEYWRRRFWWRFPPPEGWHNGYTCHYIPVEAVQHMKRHGRIIPPTRREIIADVNRWGFQHLNRCPADYSIVHSLP